MLQTTTQAMPMMPMADAGTRRARHSDARLWFAGSVAPVVSTSCVASGNAHGTKHVYEVITSTTNRRRWPPSP
jgi:hypothetical protein